MKTLAFVLLLLAPLPPACVSPRAVGLTTEALTQTASAWPMQIAEGRVYTDNDAAFLSKLRMIEGARKSIDLSYYIFADDHSSSALIKALLDAAGRGVKVRLIVDYQTNYKHLDLYSLMEKEGKGNLQIRMYGRPTANIVKDAVFMTMGCGKEMAGSRAGQCSADKFAAIDKLFADETIGGLLAAGRNISNLNIGNSGLFLSGIYAKRSECTAAQPRISSRMRCS